VQPAQTIELSCLLHQSIKPARTPDRVDDQRFPHRTYTDVP
jgi:hypothetical protein